MGPIQSALNQLTGSILGGVRNVALVGKAMAKMNEKGSTTTTATKKPVSETGAAITKPEKMGTPARIKGVSPRGSRMYSPADLAADSGNMAIMEKARSASFDIASRLSMLKKDEGGKE